MSKHQHPSPPALSIRVDGTNPNHHLWNNNGTWWVHYTVCPTPLTAERVRRSLRTRCLQTARAKRDRLFVELPAPPQPGLGTGQNP